MSSPPQTPAGSSRRALVRTVGWSVPVVAVASAAPAFAASPPAWTITSLSYEGNAAGTRNNAATYQFRFTLDILAGTTVTSPSATFSSVATANGCVISGVNPTGTAGGWNVTGSDNAGASVGAYRFFTFTRADIVGPASVTLDFTMTEVSDTDIGAAGRPFTFTSTSPTTGPTTPFTVLQTNQGAAPTYITNPAG